MVAAPALAALGISIPRPLAPRSVVAGCWWRQRAGTWRQHGSDNVGRAGQRQQRHGTMAADLAVMPDCRNDKHIKRGAICGGQWWRGVVCRTLVCPARVAACGRQQPQCSEWAFCVACSARLGPARQMAPCTAKISGPRHRGFTDAGVDWRRVTSLSATVPAGGGNPAKPAGVQCFTQRSATRTPATPFPASTHAVYAAVGNLETGSICTDQPHTTSGGMLARPADGDRAAHRRQPAAH